MKDLSVHGIRVILPVEDINALYRLIFSSIKENIHKPLLGFSEALQKQVLKSLFDMNLTDEKMRELVFRLSVKKKNAIDAITRGYEKLVRELAKGYGITDNESIISVIRNSLSNNMLIDTHNMLFQLQFGVEKTLNHIFEVNREFQGQDFARLLSEYDGDKTLEAFRRVYKSDYEKRYMQKLMDDPNIEKVVKGDKILFEKNGRYYDIEKYVERNADWTTIDTIRKVEEYRINDGGIDVVEFIRIRDVKEPREHSKWENKLFSLSGSTTEYNGNTVYPIGVIEDYQVGNPPYGCQHIVRGISKEDT